MAFKSAVDELLWIWQKKSNNIRDLNSHIWDAWADESGSIGKAYGYQLGVKHVYPEEMCIRDRAGGVPPGGEPVGGRRGGARHG